MEIENDATPNSAIEDLVAGLNAATAPGTYAFIDTGVVGTDPIRVGDHLQAGRVTPVGRRDPDQRSRPALHRHEEPPVAGPDVRAERDRWPLHGRRQPPQVEGLRLRRRRRPGHRRRAGQLQRDPNRRRPRRSSTGSPPTRPASGDPDFLIIGDLNSYAMEDPIDAIIGGGYTEPDRSQGGATPTRTCSTASPATSTTPSRRRRWLAQVDGRATGTSTPTSRPCSTTTSTSSPPARSRRSTSRTPYRSSDHDPVVVGLDLAGEPDRRRGRSVRGDRGLRWTSATGTDPDGAT